MALGWCFRLGVERMGGISAGNAPVCGSGYACAEVAVEPGAVKKRTAVKGRKDTSVPFLLRLSVCPVFQRMVMPGNSFSYHMACSGKQHR